MPTIFSALTAGIKDIRAKQAATAAAVSRTERDMSMRVVLIGSAVIVAMMWALLTFKPIPGAQTSAFANLLAAVFVVVFGFLFVTVASRISGLIGNSSNPISGMTIATLMATCAVFLVIHWTATAYAGAGADDWRRGVHRFGDCRRDFAGFEDGLSGGRDALLAADRAGDRRDGFVVCDRRHADPDEHRPRAIQAGADCAGHRSSAAGRGRAGTRLRRTTGKPTCW